MSADRLLAIRLRALGDVVLTTPALHALKRGHPDAQLEVVTDPRYAPLLEACEAVDRVWRLERSHRATLGLIGLLRRRRYRLAVDFFGNPRSALLTAASGARLTAGYDLRVRRLAYRVRVPRERSPAPGRREYAAAVHLRLAAAVGGSPGGTAPRLTLPSALLAAGERALAEAGIHEPHIAVGLVAAGSWPTKTWPLANAVLLARRLLREGLPVVLLAGPGEQSATAALRAGVAGLAVLPPGEVGTLAGVVARLAAVVGTDSGPRHLAAALDVPTFAWFGPQHPDPWSPPGERHGFWQTDLPCRACDRIRCPHWSCLPALSADRAAELVLGHLRTHGRARILHEPPAETVR
jgi:ADP-heptose:LPS heptosyltransferase